MFDFLHNNPLADRVRVARLRFTPFRLILVFFLVMVIAEFIATVPQSLYISYRILLEMGPGVFLGASGGDTDAFLTETAELTNALMGEDVAILIALFSSVIVIFSVLIFCRFIERRPLASMGLSINRSAPLSLATGALLGVAMFGIAFLIAYGMGGVMVTDGVPHPGRMILYLFGFFVEAISVELLFRGFLMLSLCNSTTPGKAVCLSALMFALFAGGSAGSTLLGFANLFFLGVFLGLLVFRAKSLWISVALYAMWCFMEGNVFGTSVGGIWPKTSILVSTPVEGHNLTNGGVFGPEASLAVSAVLLISLVVLWALSGKQLTEPSDTQSYL